MLDGAQGLIGRGVEREHLGLDARADACVRLDQLLLRSERCACRVAEHPSLHFALEAEVVELVRYCRR